MDIGIDLGTTFSVIAVNGKIELAPDYPQGIYLDECDVTVIPTPYGEPTFPSVVMEDPDDPASYLLASDALQKAEEGCLAPVAFSKRKIGTKEAILTLTRSILAKDAAREFLRHLKSCAEQALGQTVERAVVTHPAYFDRGAVEETREAAIEAGFDMSLAEQMVMEPVAAALTYTRTDKRDPLRILAYDMGGGTFDVTFLVRNSGVIEMRAFDGDHLLGGYNFDRELVQWVRERLEHHGRKVVFDESDPEDRGRLSRLLRVAEQVKLALAQAPDDNRMIDFRARGVVRDTDGRDVLINERLSRREFKRLIQRYLERSIACCRRTLEKAKVDSSELDEVLLVGGSTYGPWIAESVREAFPDATPRLFHPDLCVGAGAAIHAKMALPPLVLQGQYKLLLDVPETAVLESMNVAGRVTNVAGEPVLDKLQAKLRIPDGSILTAVPAEEEGRFLFGDIELNEGEPSQFALTICNADGTPVLERSFQVNYAPESAETSSVTTVLPRSLYIKTRDGLVPLAAEGDSLPARCEQTFQRTNANPHISLDLFQESDSIGEIRIENIPPAAGIGSFVDLEVEVTAKNQIRGSARVRTKDGQVAAHTPVRVHFEMMEVPLVDKLRGQAEQLKGRCLQTILTGDEGHEQIQAEVLPLMEEVDRLLDQQPLERQEVDVALRKLTRLLEPPRDEMEPPKQVFRRVVEECRAGLDEMARKAEEAIAESADNGGQLTMDRRVLENARNSLVRTKHLRQTVDNLEERGLEAHNRRDQANWSRLYDALTDVQQKTQERPRSEAPPTVLSKVFAQMEIMKQDRLLSMRVAEIREAGRLSDWKREIDRIQRGLNTVIGEVNGIDDDLPGEQGRAQIQRVMSRSLKPWQEAIGRLGVDISRVAR